MMTVMIGERLTPDSSQRPVTFFEAAFPYEGRVAPNLVVRPDTPRIVVWLELFCFVASAGIATFLVAEIAGGIF